MNKNNSLSDSLGQTITPFHRDIMPFLLAQSTFLDCTKFMGISQSFNKLITPLLKEPKQQIKSIYTIIDFEKKRFENSLKSNIHLLELQARFGKLKKSTIVKELTLEALSVLYSGMKKYHKFLYSSSIELVCKQVDIVLLEDPVSEEADIVLLNNSVICESMNQLTPTYQFVSTRMDAILGKLVNPVSFKLLNELTLTYLFVSTRMDAILGKLDNPVSFKSPNELTLTDLFISTPTIAHFGTLRCLTTLSLLDFKFDDKKLSLEGLQITKLIMILDISNSGDCIIPPSDLESFELTLFWRNSRIRPKSDTLTIPFIHCNKLRSL
jgi:hypothetical protein